jgi:hypothetical protein
MHPAGGTPIESTTAVTKIMCSVLRRKELLAFEQSFGFDPASRPEHLEQLRQILSPMSQ